MICTDVAHTSAENNTFAFFNILCPIFLKTEPLMALEIALVVLS